MSSPLERTQTRLHDTRSSNRTSHRNKITSNSGVEASRMREETAKRREDRLRNYDAVGREIIRVLTGNDPDSIGEVVRGLNMGWMILKGFLIESK